MCGISDWNSGGRRFGEGDKQINRILPKQQKGGEICGIPLYTPRTAKHDK